MPVRTRTLRVRPNPFTYIDHLGRPAGVCPCDPDGHTPERRWVGATIGEALLVSSAVTRVVAGATQEIAAAVHDLRWSYSEEAVTLPNTEYYRRKIFNGELIADDVATARESGVFSFKPAGLVIDQAREDAIMEFDALNGDGAFATLAEQYAEDEKRRLAALKSALAAADTEPVLTTPPSPAPQVIAPTVAEAPKAKGKGDS